MGYLGHGGISMRSEQECEDQSNLKRIMYAIKTANNDLTF